MRNGKRRPRGPEGDCGGRFCYHTDLKVAVITGEGAANAQLVAVMDRFRLWH